MLTLLSLSIRYSNTIFRQVVSCSDVLQDLVENTVIPATKIVQVDRRHYPLFFFLSLPQRTLYYGGECWIHSYWLKKDSVYSRIVERGVLLPSKRVDQISSKGTISVFKDPDSIIILMRACARAYSFPNKTLCFLCTFML